MHPVVRLPHARYVRGYAPPGERPQESTALQRIAMAGRIQPEDGCIRVAASSDPTTIVARLDVDQALGEGGRVIRLDARASEAT